MKEENASLKNQVGSVESIQQLEKKYKSQLGSAKKIFIFVILFVYAKCSSYPINY